MVPAGSVKLSANIGASPVSRKILSYLAEHPQAADTIEEIEQWWLHDVQLQPSRDQLEEAMDYLVAQQFVLTRKSKDGRTSYSMNPEKQEQINRRLDG